MHFPENGWMVENETIRKYSSRAFQWMVNLVSRFQQSLIFGAISVSHPQWQKSPSVLKELIC
jgi:hypothetical protein